MAWLLVDNSNTRTKFALGDASGLLEWRGTIATPEIGPETLAELLEGVAFEAVLIGSVVPAKRAILAAELGRRAPVHLLGPDSPLGLGIDYPNPAQIGADRLANAVGVIHRHHAPAIVIDFGTAVTFDVVDASPAWIGGVIAPGLGSMSEYLTRRTALLPVVELAEPPSAIGKSTVHAMQVGAVYGYRGLVKEILSKLLEELPGDVAIIATGGDAALIAAGVPEIQAVDADITLDGLRRVAVAVFG
ncbi:type III pantothenate kinase [Luteolibacter sp. LG18]|uniref:type III pantothenate kinase n=1 Tax=Luteolibacter sp. LG18 TaxID=2819286 RepID=UPI002B31FB92|nr:type III pantothenate kinase [Luteolibacter sp. LG18]